METESRRLSLIPDPVSVKYLDGTFEINLATKILSGPTTAALANKLCSVVSEVSSLQLPIQLEDTTQQGYIALKLKASGGYEAEGYSLDVTPLGVIISASEEVGLFYGIQTFRQIIDQTERAETVEIPCLSVRDRPRFQWRGLMLDCSRTFQSLDYLRKTIDRMSSFKMNVLHLHLTDDQGWRVEIERYPELTSKGSRFAERFKEPEEAQGFYRKEELRDLVEYAAARGVTIVPEIEMPGHSGAIVSCFPDLSCRGDSFEIFPFFQGPNITSDLLCAGNDRTFEFLEAVLEEVLEVFPSEYIHIGGDEAPKDAWEKCTKCQARIEEEGLEDEEALQGWFVQRIGNWIRERNRKLIGWDEILEGGVGKDSAVMSWRGIEGGIEGASSGHKVVMSPVSHLYLDFSPIQIPMKKTYLYEPVPEELTADQAKLIIGVQGNHWSHIDRTPSRVDAMLYPRLLAIAERGWSPSNRRDWDDFSRRVDAQLESLRESGATLWVPPVAEWKAAEGIQELTIDVTDRITASGRFRVFFRKKAWEDTKIRVNEVTLLSDGHTVAHDHHTGIVGWDWEKPDYMLEVGEFEQGRQYQLKIRLETLREGGGEIYLEPVSID